MNRPGIKRDTVRVCAECDGTHAAALWLVRNEHGREGLHRYTCLESYIRLPLKKRYLLGDGALVCIS